MRHLILLALLSVLAAQPAVADEAGEVELSPLMLRLQIHMDKLYWAGKAQNWPLAAFYTHELNETLETITKAKIVDEGVNVSVLANPMLAGALGGLDSAVKAKRGFVAKYEATVQACNGCHAATKHEFIRIQVPTRPIFSNQVYAP
ncbi:MAG: hypothetical protein ACI9U2_004529 [Bradymonadia bacterium]|jgi:hypothetical protein